MNNYYITFGQKYGPEETHPTGGHKDGWFRVVAKDAEEAREKMFKDCGPKWSMCYEEQPNIETFPLGELKVIE